MAWENIKGKIVIFDNQNGKRYEGPQEIAHLASMLSDSGITRLDDIPLNSNFLMRWLKDA